MPELETEITGRKLGCYSSRHSCHGDKQQKEGLVVITMGNRGSCRGKWAMGRGHSFYGKLAMSRRLSYHGKWEIGKDLVVTAMGNRQMD